MDFMIENRVSNFVLDYKNNTMIDIIRNISTTQMMTHNTWVLHSLVTVAFINILRLLENWLFEISFYNFKSELRLFTKKKRFMNIILPYMMPFWFAAESSLLYGDKWRTDFIFLRISKGRNNVNMMWNRDEAKGRFFAHHSLIKLDENAPK